MLMIALMSLWFKRKDSHTVKFANDRLVGSEDFESELLSFFLLISFGLMQMELMRMNLMQMRLNNWLKRLVSLIFTW